MKLLNIFFPSIACNSTIASNKQRQEHNNLATMRRAQLKGAHKHSKSLQIQKPWTQMQTLTRMNKAVIEDYYHMITMDENVNWMEVTHLLLKQIFIP